MGRIVKGGRPHKEEAQGIKEEAALGSLPKPPELKGCVKIGARERGMRGGLICGIAEPLMGGEKS